MSRYYGLPEAHEALPEVERILIALRDEREALIGLRDRMRTLEEEVHRTEAHAGTGEPPADDPARPTGARAGEIKRIHLRMQGLVDQMQAGVARLVELEIQLRDIPTGLIDFPALAAGRPIWLCWRLGEDRIGWWHAHDEGFDARRPLAELGLGLPTQ